MKKKIVTTISYSRYELGNNSVSGRWEILSKQFDTDKEADLFIFRIKDNALVGDIWKRKDLIIGG